MFRKTDPQTSLLESRFLVPPSKRARLDKSWARPFNERVLPLIEEEIFRGGFHEDNGRPNKSIRLLTGLHLLKEMDDLTDEQVLENLEYNLQWHYALGLESEDAHTCQKTLHNYRVRLMENERARAMFDKVTGGLAEMDGLGWSRQRLDSTHIMSNIAALTRLGLFTETVTKFLHELRRDSADKLESLDGGYSKRYLEREGYFADAKREQARRRLPVVARDLLALVRVFESDKEVREWESYGLMVRLLEEQCEVIEPGDEGQPVEAPPVEVPPAASVEGEPEKTTGKGDKPESKGTDDDEPRCEDVNGTDETGEATEQDDEDGADERSDVPPTEPLESKDPGLRLKEGKEISGGSLQSPHDPDATYGHKGKGYEVQIAETCEESNPYQIITGIDVNGANESDQHATVPMVEQLSDKGFGPRVLFTDTAYNSGENIVECAELGVDLYGPVQDPGKPSPVDHWAEPVEPLHSLQVETTTESVEPQGLLPTAKATDSEHDRVEPMGFESFKFNDTYWRVESCPAGHAPVEQEVRDAPVPYRAVFSEEQCGSCPFADRCPTRRLKSGVRVLHWRDVKAATATRQMRQQEPAFKEDYKIRSGVESTAGEFKGRHGAKKMRVRGAPRVEMMALMKATALNAKRMVQYHTRLLNTALMPALAPDGAVE